MRMVEFITTGTLGAKSPATLRQKAYPTRWYAHALCKVIYSVCRKFDL